MFIFGKKSDLKPSLNFWQLFFMAVSGTLGAGLFVLMGEGAAIAGRWLPLSFIFAGFLAFLLSMIYAELATSMPAAGGGQVYLRTAFGHHPLLFIVHFLTWLAELAFTALNALGLGTYLSLVLPLPPIIISIIALGLLLVINLKGVKNIGKIEVGVGIALIFSLIAVAVLLGLNLPANSLNLSKLNSSRFNFNWIYAIPMVYLVFVGNEDIAAIVEEVIDKEKNVPKVLLSSVVAITLLTATLSFLFINAFSLNQVIGNDQTFALLAQLNGQCGYMIGVTIAIFACVSSLFYGSLADTRTAFALSEAGELPKFFSKVNDNQVPAGSIIANISIVLILTLTRSAPLIAYIANIGLFLESIFVSLALLKLRKTRPHLPRNFLVKPFPLIPIIVILLNILLLMTVEVQAWSITIATSVIGLSFYLLSQSNQERKMWGAIGISLGVVITLAATYFLINNSQIMTQLLMMFIT